LGKRYRDGIGVPKNKEAEAKWFLAAAERGHARAQHHVGLRFLNGDGVKKDLVAAFMWLTLSSRAGDKVAAREREKLLSQISDAQRKEAESMADKWQPKPTSANG